MGLNILAFYRVTLLGFTYTTKYKYSEAIVYIQFVSTISLLQEIKEYYLWKQRQHGCVFPKRRANYYCGSEGDAKFLLVKITRPKVDQSYSSILIVLIRRFQYGRQYGRYCIVAP